MSLRKYNVNIFYEVSKEYYGVGELPLNEHRDIDMHLWHKITILSNMYFEGAWQKCL